MALQPVKTLSDISTDRCAVVIKNSTKTCERWSLGTKIFRDEVQVCLVRSKDDVKNDNVRHAVDIQQKLLQKLGIAEVRYYERIKRSNFYRELVDSKATRTIIARRVGRARRQQKAKAAKAHGDNRISKARQKTDGRVGTIIDLTSNSEEDESHTYTDYDTESGYDSDDLLPPAAALQLVYIMHRSGL